MPEPGNAERLLNLNGDRGIGTFVVDAADDRIDLAAIDTCWSIAWRAASTAISV